MALQIDENLRSLSDDDIDSVATQLPSKSRFGFSSNDQGTKISPRRDTTDKLPAALGKAWDSGLHATVEAELNRLTARQ